MRLTMRDAFYSWQPAAHQEPINSSAPRMISGPEEDYTDVFLSHARVFVFVGKFDIQPLKRRRQAITDLRFSK